MKIVAFGGKGMVGSRVVELLQSNHQFVIPTENEVDITDEKLLKEYLSKEKPQVVINFAATTDVDACEIERENIDGAVWRVNAKAPGTISKLSKELNFFMIQISTDMVFSGSKADPGPYEESHSIPEYNLLTWYGASKAEGERNVLAENAKNAIIRIIYPVRSDFPSKLDYARKILRLYDDGHLYPMFTDQTMNVTYIDELAHAIEIIIEKQLKGMFHVCTSNTATPYEFASALLKKHRNVEDVVRKSSITEFIKGKDPRRYPQFGGLKNDDTQEALQMDFSTWEEVLELLANTLQIK